MISTVGELRKFLTAQDISPERLAPILKISNMTIRRLLDRADTDKIPDRYEPHFERLERLMNQSRNQKPWSEAESENRTSAG